MVGVGTMVWCGGVLVVRFCGSNPRKLLFLHILLGIKSP